MTPEQAFAAVDEMSAAFQKGGMDPTWADTVAGELVYTVLEASARTGDPVGEVTDADIDAMMSRLQAISGSATKNFSLGAPLSTGFVPYDLPGTAGAICSGCGGKKDRNGNCERCLHKSAGGNPEALRRWYVNGAGGKIDWGKPGDFDACVSIARDHGLENPEGYCNLRHQEATGGPPGHAPGETKKVWTVCSAELADHISKGDLLTDPHPIGFWTAPPDPTDGLVMIEFLIPQDFDTDEGEFPGGATFEVTSKDGERIVAQYRKDFTSISPIRNAAPVESDCDVCGAWGQCSHRSSVLDELNAGPAGAL